MNEQSKSTEVKSTEVKPTEVKSAQGTYAPNGPTVRRKAKRDVR